MDEPQGACEVVVQPAEVDAGSEMTLVVRVSDARLAGRALEIRDHDGGRVAMLSLSQADGDEVLTARTRVRAPEAPGTYAWTAHIDAAGAKGGDQPAPAGRFAITVVEHATRLLVWDVPSAIEAGATFSAKVGLKCSSGCDMAGRSFGVFDHEGREVLTERLTDAIWPGSEGLHFAELEFRAPATAELFRWQVRTRSSPSGTPHAEGACSFSLRTVAPADVTVRIEAVDSERGDPLPRMSVLMHPYRTRTDEHGVAEVRAARGTYAISVSGRGYYPVQRRLDLSEDVTTRALLKAEPPPSRDW